MPGLEILELRLELQVEVRVCVCLSRMRRLEMGMSGSLLFVFMDTVMESVAMRMADDARSREFDVAFDVEVTIDEGEDEGEGVRSDDMA